MTQPTPIRPRQVLQSWKEIASYLHVTVRTVQRWEKEAGLVVHRQGTGRKARVVAYCDEIDAWLAGHKEDTKEPKPESRRTLVLGIVAIGIILIAVLAWIHLPSEPEPLSATVEATRFRVLNSRKQVLWEKHFPPASLSEYQNYEAWSFVEVDGDPGQEVLFNYVPARAAELRGKLICYDSDGRQLWEFEYGAARTFENRTISANFIGTFFRLVEVGDRSYVLAVAGHHLWFPAQVVLLDPKTGAVRDEYWHPGGFRRVLLEDLDGDGTPELLLAGINNPGVGLGHGCLAVLDLPFGPPNTHVAATSPFGDLTLGKEKAYLLFPRPDFSDVEGYLPIVQDLSVTGDRRILVRMPASETSIFYYLDFNLRLVDFRFADNLPSVHDRLFKLGLLDHKLSKRETSALGNVRAFPTAPDGNSPDVLELMRPGD